MNSKKLLLFLVLISSYAYSYCTAHRAPIDNALKARIYENLERAMPPTLYAPWRSAYEGNNNKPVTGTNCPLCDTIQAQHDEDFFIVCRTACNVAMLNPFPYATGHILIVPLGHKASITDLSAECRADMMELAAQSLNAIKAAYGLIGANVGFNIGNSGASIPDHVHMHIVPRNTVPSFMQIIGQTSVIVSDLKEVYNTLKPYFYINNS